MIFDLVSDLRFGLRQMARRPALYGLAVLSLGLALGANTAIFSVVDALFFRGAPGIGEPSRLVAMYARDRDGQWGTFRYSDFVEIQKSGVFSSLAAQLFPVGVSFSMGGDPEMVQGLLVSRQYFPVLKAQPALGRTFGPGERGETGVVISRSFWRRRFASGIRMAIGEDRPSILGRILRGALLLAALGVLVGALAALWLSALVRSQLFGVAPTDPLTFSLAALLLLLVALLAALAPALRATRIQPAVALRTE